MKTLDRIILVLFFQIVLTGIGFSATLKVPSTYATIQSAIDAAVDGDTVLVDNGIYVENINFLGKAITVKVNVGHGATIDGNQVGSVVSFLSGEGPDSILKGFKITNGNAAQGGGIKMMNNSKPLILNNNITGNQAYEGGGIYCGNNTDPSTNPKINGNKIYSNTAQDNASSTLGGGGGIFCENASPEIFGTNLIYSNLDNTVRTAPPFTLGGGGICLSGYCDAQIYDNEIYNNTTQYGSGGGIACYKESAPNAIPKIMDNKIYGNKALGTFNDAGTFSFMGTGGGISCKLAVDPRIADNDIYDNYVEQDGGGIEIQGNADLTHSGTKIMDNLIHNNSCKETGVGNSTVGGGIFCGYKRSPAIYNNVLYDNEADNGGGIGIVHLCYPLVRNNLVFFNTAYSYGGGFFIHTGNINDPLQFHSNTIAWNVAQSVNNQWFGGGIYCINYHLTLVSCIMWANNASAPTQNGGEIEYSAQGCNLTIRYSDVRGCQSPPQLGWVRVTLGNYIVNYTSISADPKFVYGSSNNDFRLNNQSPNISPCINTGSPHIPEVFGTTRTDNVLDEVGNGMDMGYHYIGFTNTYLSQGIELSLLADCISLPTSQQQVLFALHAGLRHASRTYVILGSMTPGSFQMPGGLVTVPFGWDAYTNIVIQFLNTFYYTNFQGDLDHLGRIRPNHPAGSVIWNIHPDLLASGQNYYYAFTTVTPYDYVSNRVDMTVQ